MYQSVHQTAIDIDADSHSRSHGDIYGILTALCGAPGHFAQYSGIYIRIDSYRYTKGLPQPSGNIYPGPARLWCLCDTAKGSRAPV